MKLNGIDKKTYCLASAGILLILTSMKGNAGAMGPQMVAAPGKIYVGVFGGAGSSNKINMSQYGTAFFTESESGPLAVNAFGKTNSRTAGLVGGHVGYQWMDISSNLFNSQLSLAPAVELEGYYLGNSSYTGHDINNDTSRLLEHDFLVKYPMNAGVFLANAILNFNPVQSRIHPYIGAGIGAAVLSISNATSTQVLPSEPDVNHYNSNASNTAATFAAQGKVGLNFEVSNNISIFAEYRGLYLADSNYTFGSTVYPTHAQTSSWQVLMGSQYFNMGAIGVHYTI